MTMLDGQSGVHASLARLGRRLLYEYADPIALVVCGGSALNVVGIAQRTTRDVDVLALAEETRGGVVLRTGSALPEAVVNAVARVGTDLGLRPDWLNMGPKDLVVIYGIPPGMLERLVRHQYGPSLTVFFIGRFDQVHFKVLAAADPHAQPHHMEDLNLRIKPSADELRAAVTWLLDRKTSPQFRARLKHVVNELGYEQAAADIP
ncbi:hypothetical protein GX586_01050 [bacterium]|nr:hypothetical protein [bacterium]